MEYWLIFNVAFFASLSHCVGMCGSIVLALSHKVAKAQANPLASHLLYNCGRLSSYVLIGALCGGLGLVFEITPWVKSWALIVVGVLVMLFACLLILSPRLLGALEPNVARTRIVGRGFSVLLGSSSLWSFYLLGLLNGFLPCGIVYYFALIALSRGRAWEGMLVMGIFGICTLLPMLFTALFSSLILGLRRCRRAIFFCSTLLMMVLGLYTIYKGVKGL